MADEAAPAKLPIRQLFAPGADAILRLAVLSVFGVLVGSGVLLFLWSHGDFVGDIHVVSAQPVEFSHKHHAGELGIDCRNCHEQVESQATAGMPPTHTCMTCHSQIWTHSPMLAPVRDSLAQNQPLHWTRINRVPDYVYFNHSIHIAKGVGCSSCHGAVDTMQMTYAAHAFRMEFCLNCHRNPQQFLRTPDQVWNMEWRPPANQSALGAKLAAEHHIAAPERLSDCSVCHR